MNERIKEFARMSGLNVDGEESFSEFAEKTRLSCFAELIVKECVSIGDNYQDILGDEPECFNCRKVAYGIVDKIKQHFGVEE